MLQISSSCKGTFLRFCSTVSTVNEILNTIVCVEETLVLKIYNNIFLNKTIQKLPGELAFKIQNCHSIRC